MKYILASDCFKETFEATNLEEMKGIADEVIGYSEDSARILDATGNTILIYRPWYNCMDGVETQENPIVFGQSGFYGDWVEV